MKSEGRAAELRRALLARYRSVAVSAEGQFPYPVGRESAERLGYVGLQDVPDEVVQRFVGIGNPLRHVRLDPGMRVLDIGSGVGLDAFVARAAVGAQGRVVGVDLTEEMLAIGARRARGIGIGFVCGDAVRLPFGDESFDVVTSNGALNLVFDKPAAFGELARVLRRGGWLTIADVMVIDTLPAEVLASMDAWST